MKLDKVEAFLETSGLNVKLEDGVLTVTEKMDEGYGQVPTDLMSFVTIYEQETSIVPKGKGYEVTCTKFSANNFMKLLSSVFGADYDFEMTGEYTVLIKAKGANEANESKSDSVDFMAIAESIDSESVEIELHEDGLKIITSTPTQLAEDVDGKYSNLDIDVYEDYILVSEGK